MNQARCSMGILSLESWSSREDGETVCHYEGVDLALAPEVQNSSGSWLLLLVL